MNPIKNRVILWQPNSPLRFEIEDSTDPGCITLRTLGPNNHDPHLRFSLPVSGLSSELLIQIGRAIFISRGEASGEIQAPSRRHRSRNQRESQRGESRVGQAASASS